MIYGISKSKDILLSSISEALNEKTKKAYVIDRLSDKLSCELDDNIDKNYCNTVIDSSGESPVFIIDDSDVVKLLGSKFEDLGIVRDGSSKNKTYEKGYHVTEIVGLTKNKKQPISMFSKVHSSVSKEYVSANSITFEGLNRIITILQEKNKKGIFVNDRGYDNNEIFNLLEQFHTAGFKILLDDFGSGYSSLAALNRMHFDTIKLDKSLVDYIGDDNGEKLLNSITKLAQSFGMEITAEGVETVEQLMFLCNLDCDDIQGYYFSRPLPVKEYEECLKEACM